MVLQAGLVEQVGSPLELYHRPRNMFVAGFMGSPRMNLLPATVSAVDHAGVTVDAPGGIHVTAPVATDRVNPGMKVTFGVRPEHVVVNDNGPIAGRALIAERLGGLTLLHVELPDKTMLVVQADGAAAPQVHAPVRLAIDGVHCHVFLPDGVAADHQERHPLVA